MHGRCESGSRNNFAGKLVPGALAAIGGMHNPAGSLTAKLHDGAGQICRVRGRPSLIAHDFQLGPGRGQFQNCVRESTSRQPQKARRSERCSTRAGSR